MIRDIEQDDGVLIFDDTIQEKPYTDENDLICWHYDHSQNRTVKGINLLNCVYHASLNIAMYWPIVGSQQRKTYSLFATAWISTSLSQ